MKYASYEKLKSLKMRDKDLNTILKKSGGGFLIKMSHIIIGFLTSVLLARWFGAATLGEYTFAITIINFLKIIAVFGFPVLTIREVAKLYDNDRLSELKNYLLTSNFIVLALSLSISIFYFCFLKFSQISISSASVDTLKFSIPILVFLAFINIHSTTLRGRGFIIKSLLQEQLFSPVLFLTAIILIYFFSDVYTAEMLMRSQIIVVLVSFIIGLILLKPFALRLSQVKTNKIEFSRYLKKASPFLLLGGIQILNSQIDIFMLGIFLNAEEVGIYKVVFSVSQVILFIMISMNTTLTPDMAKLYYSDRKEKLEKILVQTSRIVVILSVPILLIYILFGEEILGLAFGDEFKVGYYALIITSFGMLINALAGPTSGVLNMTGFERYAFWGSVTLCLINITLNILLIPKFGIEGAALTTAFAPILANTVWLYHIKTKVGISITALGKI